MSKTNVGKKQPLKFMKLRSTSLISFIKLSLIILMPIHWCHFNLLLFLKCSFIEIKFSSVNSKTNYILRSFFIVIFFLNLKFSAGHLCSTEPTIPLIFQLMNDLVNLRPIIERLKNGQLFKCSPNDINRFYSVRKKWT